MKNSKTNSSPVQKKSKKPFTVTQAENGDVQVEILEGYLQSEFGIDNVDVVGRLFSEIALTGNNGKTNIEEARTLEAVGVVKALAPQDALECLLVSQMFAVHTTMLKTARMLAVTDHLDNYEIYEKAMNRLARTFTAQVEALSKYRRKGTQKVVVQHVNVQDGGQAIVGDVGAMGGVQDEI